MSKEKELALEITKQAYENRISKLVADAETDKKECDTHRTLCKKMREEIDTINRRYDDNCRQLVEAENRVVELERQLDSVRKDMEREKDVAVSEIRQQMRTAVDEATDLAMKLRQDVTEKTEELSASQSEIRRVTESVQNDKNMLMAAQAEVEAARGRVERMMTQIGELQSEKNIFQEELDAACEKCLLAIKDKEELEDELRQTSSLYSRLRQMEEDHAMEKSNWTKGKLDLMRSESDARRECARLQRENQDLKDAVSRNSEQLNSTKSKQLEQLRHERDELLNDNDALSREKEVLRQQLSTVKLDLEMIRSQATLTRTDTQTKPRSRECSFQRPSTFTIGKTARTNLLKDININIQEPTARRGIKVEMPGPLLIQGPTATQLRTVRCFAVTGFDDKSIIEKSVLDLPDAEIHQIQPNSCSVPPELTHLITNGNMTIKLLAALVRGCWILPKSYVDSSLLAGKWLPETEYGFRHNIKPLKGKTVAFTKKFSQGRYGKTMELLVEGGGGEVFKVEDDSCTDHCDFVMCQNTERELYLSNGCTWEQMVSRIYPQKIGESSNSQRSSLIPSHGRIPVTA